jgi:hypothetical protein
MRGTLCIIVLIASVVPLHGRQLAYMDGNRLLQQCEPGTSEHKARLSADRLTDFAFCSGYVGGVMDANTTLVSSMSAEGKRQVAPMYCLSEEGIEVGQAVRITVKWLREHPEKLHLEGDILVYMSLTDAFPCK